MSKSVTSPQSSVLSRSSAVSRQRSAVGRAGMFLIIGFLLAGALAGCQGREVWRQTPTPASSPRPAAPATRPALTPTSARATATIAPTPTPAASALATATATTQPTAAGAGYPGKLVVRGADGLLTIVRADGSGLRKLTDGIDPSWSPDGKRIAFVRWREPWGLYVINADGSGERLLVAEKHLRAPAWSPRGNVIAVLVGRLETIPPTFFTPAGERWVHTLKAVNPTSGAYEGDFPADKFVLSPSWSPDGVHLTYDGERGIYVTAMGADPRLLTPELVEATNGAPAWSPKGDRIAYVRQMRDHVEVWSMDTAGGDRRRLTPAGDVVGEQAYNSVAPAWSPDGRYIAFLTDRAGEWQVYVMRADGTGQRRLLSLPVKYEFNSDRILDWTE